jgi:RNA polymerase sigma factor (TIGR02999 family)
MLPSEMSSDPRPDGPHDPAPAGNSQRSHVTRLLVEWSDGDQGALDQLIPFVYSELHAVAHRRLRAEKSGHTLQTTALVHEAYVRLVDAELAPRNRAHFFALAARTMRQILVDYARARLSAKRGGAAEMLPLEDVQVASGDGEDNLEILALHDALDALAQQDERKARVIEAHIFGGLSYAETATALGISEATVDRELRLAKAWLARELS